MRLIQILVVLAISLGPLSAQAAQSTRQMSVGVQIIGSACGRTALCQAQPPTLSPASAPNYVTYRAPTALQPAVWTRTY